jgi:hypothetical protein
MGQRGLSEQNNIRKRCQPFLLHVHCLRSFSRVGGMSKLAWLSRNALHLVFSKLGSGPAFIYWLSPANGLCTSPKTKKKIHVLGKPGYGLMQKTHRTH